jgi:hypothetical protein
MPNNRLSFSSVGRQLSVRWGPIWSRQGVSFAIVSSFCRSNFSSCARTCLQRHSRVSSWLICDLERALWINSFSAVRVHAALLQPYTSLDCNKLTCFVGQFLQSKALFLLRPSVHPDEPSRSWVHSARLVLGCYVRLIILGPLLAVFG